jgi:hypothetical protein
MIGKLLGVASVGSALASVGLMQRFLSGITKVVILAVVSAFMLCALLAGGFTMAYFCLVHYGLDQFAAGIAVGIVAFFITAALVTLTIVQLRQLRDLTQHILHPYRIDLPDIGNVANAFIDGLLNRRA